MDAWGQLGVILHPEKKKRERENIHNYQCGSLFTIHLFFIPLVFEDN